MTNKILILLLLISSSCGKNITISNRMLENNSELSTDASSLQEGTLIRGKPDQIKLNNTLYKVSLYSSYNALEFIASKALDTQLTVKFRGKVKNSEIILETIQPK